MLKFKNTAKFMVYALLLGLSASSAYAKPPKHVVCKYTPDSDPKTTDVGTCSCSTAGVKNICSNLTGGNMSKEACEQTVEAQCEKQVNATSDDPINDILGDNMPPTLFSPQRF